MQVIIKVIPLNRYRNGGSYLFIYFGLHSVCVAARGLSLVWVSRGYSLVVFFLFFNFLIF